MFVSDLDHSTSEYAAEILLKSASLIEENGWCAGSFMGTDGSLCSVGAIQQAAFHEIYGAALLIPREINRFDAYHRALEALAEQINEEELHSGYERIVERYARMDLQPSPEFIIWQRLVLCEAQVVSWNDRLTDDRDVLVTFEKAAAAVLERVN